MVLTGLSNLENTCRCCVFDCTTGSTVSYTCGKANWLSTIAEARRARGYNKFFRSAQNFQVTIFTLMGGASAAMTTCFVYRYNILFSAMHMGFSPRSMFLLSLVVHAYFVLSIGVVFRLSFVPYDSAKVEFLRVCD